MRKSYVRSLKFRTALGVTMEEAYARHKAAVDAAEKRLRDELASATRPLMSTCRYCEAEFPTISRVGRPREFCPKCYGSEGQKQYRRAYQRRYYRNMRESLVKYREMARKSS